MGKEVVLELCRIEGGGRVRVNRTKTHWHAVPKIVINYIHVQRNAKRHLRKRDYKEEEGNIKRNKTFQISNYSNNLIVFECKHSSITYLV